MHEEVRPALASDASAILELEEAARATLVAQRGGPALLAEQPATIDWATAADDPQCDVFVGTIDGVVVGYLEQRLRNSAAVVHQVYVHPEARELGFGDWLLEAAMAAARRRGCTTLEGHALPGDRDTKNLFERAGITARKIVVSTRLD
jgi:GNAT superfamily N-acetyltransferase